ncbi:hypothetical protein BJX66DRAFT_341923 [Aspergillus keveii]|uniref:VWFD domain-containing protein n=1 Tax=Aspergillus keveii TaxID=714993 RepID=A0ABR4FTW3_9EURO
MDALGVWVDGRQFYLAYPDAKAVECICECDTDLDPCQTVFRDQKSSAPRGIEHISGEDNYYGGNAGTLKNLMSVDVTTPGFMRIPICSPVPAFLPW